MKVCDVISILSSEVEFEIAVARSEKILAQSWVDKKEHIERFGDYEVSNIYPSLMYKCRDSSLYPIIYIWVSGE